MQPRTAINKNTGKYRTKNEIQESTGQLQNTGIYRIHMTAGMTDYVLWNVNIKNSVSM